MTGDPSNTDLQEQLLEALLEGNFSDFQQLLNHPSVNANHRYGKPHFSTCLEIASRNHSRAQFVKELLRHVKPNINQVFPEPIHYAAGRGNSEALEILLADKRTKVGAEDSLGRTALHHVARNFTPNVNIARYERCVALLMARQDLDINRPHKRGFTAIHEAAASGSKEAVLAMLKYGEQDLDIDKIRGHGRTARETILIKYPELKPVLPARKMFVHSLSDPVSRLIEALENQHLEIFRGLLLQVDSDGNALIDPNLWFGKPRNSTCLEHACRQSSCEEFVKALLQAGADPNMVNPITGKFPIHVSAENETCESLEALVSDKRTNVNVQDRDGRTALHYALNYRERNNNNISCLSLLLKHPKINLNITNKKGHTPIMSATTSGTVEAIRIILKLGSDKLDLDSIISQEEDLSEIRQRTARQIILSKYPELETVLPESTIPQIEKPNFMVMLVEHIHKRETKQFNELLDKHNENVNGDDGSYTFLQYACRHGLCDIAEKLLQLGADPDLTYSSNKWPPFVLAASKQHKDILQLFLKLPSTVKFNIDATDAKGNTALHYAAKFGDTESISALLRSGANIKIKNVFDKPPLSVQTVEALLDQCLISDSNHYPEEEDYRVSFNYGILVPQIQPNNQNFSAEMDFLYYLSQSSEHRLMLKHPIITSFLQLKWNRVKLFFYLNLLVYALFVLALNVYVLLEDESDGFCYFGDKDTKLCFPQSSAVIVRYILTGLLSLLVIRELFQLFISPMKYIQNIENYLDLSLIVSTSLFLGLGNEPKSTVTVVMILLSWLELVLLTGRLPVLSRNIEMLKTVSWTFLSFMMWYSLVIMAFAVSFYTMFRDAQSTSEPSFSSPGTAVFRTILMMTGELGSENIPFEEAGVTSHLVFIVFVFLIAIVLINLLTALAISDTQAIQNDAEMLSLMSRIRLVYEIENMLLLWHHNINQISFLRALMERFECCVKSISLFPPTIADKHFYVLPNKGMQVISSQTENKKGCTMDLETLGAAMNIIGSQGRISDIDLIKMKLENIEKSKNQMNETLSQVLEILQSSVVK